MNLNLTKPIAFFDLETTGVNVGKDRIVEISILKISPEGEKVTKTQRVNPGIPIPAESSDIHGIYDVDVKNEPMFKDIAEDISTLMDGCDLAGYNAIRFDIPLLAEEFLRAEVDFNIKNRRLIDVQNIFHQMEKRTLEAAYQFYCTKELTNAHSAEADNLATYEILEAQLTRYNDHLKNDMDFLHDFSMRHKNADLAGRFVYDDEDRVVFNFGKHKGKPVEDVLQKEPSYYGWMMNGDFPLYTKRVLKEIKENMFYSV